MDFSRRKLPKDEFESLFRVRVDTVKPYALMLAPVYIYLKANEKFVAVKAPLDFFTESELMRLKSFKYFYFSEFITSVLPFREAGEQVREILLNRRVEPPVAFPPSPFELSDAVLGLVGPLWWEYKEGMGIDPFGVTVFANELCQLIPSERLLMARERSTENYDLALYRSSWVVFLALHLGYCDLDFLNELRVRIFEENIAGDPQISSASEVEELIATSYASLRSSRLKIVKAEVFQKNSEKVSLKLSTRIRRIKKEFLSKGSYPPSIYGKRGFIDV